MIKMVIKMNENKIQNSDKYSIEEINAAIDRIFIDRGMEKKEISDGVEYYGHERDTDFAYFAKIMTGLKKQSWFMDNADTWLLCNNDDMENPTEYNEEDLLAHYGMVRV